MLLIHVCLAAMPPTDTMGNYVATTLIGLGRYAKSPALFLECERGGPVLPVPVPVDAVSPIEQALSARRPSRLEVLLHTRFADRDGGLYDNLPWPEALPQAKGEAYARLTGRGYPKEGYASAYHLLLDAIACDTRAHIERILIERTNVLGDFLVLGGCALVAPHGAEQAQSDAEPAQSDSAQSEPVLCECSVDEALGLALAATDAQVVAC